MKATSQDSTRDSHPNHKNCTGVFSKRVLEGIRKKYPIWSQCFNAWVNDYYNKDSNGTVCGECLAQQFQQIEDLYDRGLLTAN